MASYPTPQSVKFNTFKGIRTRNGIASNGVLSATVCKNVDFVPSSYDAGVIIQTTLGNYKYCELSSTTYPDYEIVKGFGFETENGTFLMLYIEDTTAEVGDTAKGLLVKYYNGDFTTIQYNSADATFTKTGEANAITMLDSAYNTFVFTNGIEYFAYCPDSSTVAQFLSPEYDNNAITGLAMCEQDGSLVIGSNEGIVLASAKGDITDFDYNATASANKAWYQLFGKPVTAVVPYIDALLVFTEEDSTMLTGNFSNGLDGGAERKDASLGGCMSFESWVKHDKYLFFYDNNQKNVYYYTQNDYGQKVLGEPIAPEVQKFFDNVERLQMVSYVGENRSEIWLLSDSFKLIYDYYIGEWSERDCQELTSYFVYDNSVYSTGGNKCLKEKAGNMCMFDKEYIPAEYTTQIINLGSFSNMKEMEFQPLVSVTQTFNNTFYIDCQIDGKKTKSKYVKMFFNGAVWGDDEPQDDSTPDSELWDIQTYPTENDAVIQQIKGKFISNWYYLQFTFRTEKQGDDFSITCMELKGITQETDTTGRK